LNEILGVALVHDREVPRQAGFGTEVPEQAVARGVEGSALDAGRRRADEAFGRLSILRRAGEREEENPPGDAAVEEVGDAIDEFPSCRCRAGDDRQSLGVGAAAPVRVQLCGEVVVAGDVRRALGGEIIRYDAI
jgi:hypothetical protein